MMIPAPTRFKTSPNASERGSVVSPVHPTGYRHAEDGFVLLIVMFMLALLIISMAVGLPKMAASIQRDKEIETYHRGMQYRRAIQLYYRKFNRYPPNMDALVKTNDIRFLRKKYIDPMTRKDDWKPIQFGQNKTPMAMGFFGQPLGGIGMAAGALAGGVGPGGDNGMAGGAGIGNSTFGTGAAGSNTFGSSTGNSGIGTSGIGNSPAAGGSTIGAGGSTVGTATGTPGATDANGNPADTTGASGLGTTGQTFGGVGIIGVSPASPKVSLFVYKKKNHYNEWEFLYSQLSDQMMMPGGNGGAGLGAGTNGGIGTGSGVGSGIGSGTGTNGGIGTGLGSGTGSGTGSGLGSSAGGTSGTGTTGTTPTSPQQ